MSKITKEAYETLKKEGKTDAFIASYFGITPATLSYHKKNWESAAADKTTETYDELMQQLKQQLKEKDGLIHTLEKRIEELEAERENEKLIRQNEKLRKLLEVAIEM